MIKFIHRFFCRHSGAMMRLEADSIKLVCPDCGHISEGWDLTGRPNV